MRFELAAEAWLLDKLAALGRETRRQRRTTRPRRKWWNRSVGLMEALAAAEGKTVRAEHEVPTPPVVHVQGEWPAGGIRLIEKLVERTEAFDFPNHLATRQALAYLPMVFEL